jgi:hypothetical protein
MSISARIHRFIRSWFRPQKGAEVAKKFFHKDEQEAQENCFSSSTSSVQNQGLIRSID